MTELIGAREIDFRDHPRFSRRYFVLASDERLFRNYIERKILDLIGEHHDLVVEIRDDWLMACLPEKLTSDDIVRLAEFAVAADALR